MLVKNTVKISRKENIIVKIFASVIMYWTEI